MLFNSFEFAVFFPIVATVFFILPHRWRWLWLLASSCYFYICFIPVYIFVLLLAIVVDYWAAIWIERSTGAQRKMYLIVSILSTCAILFVFKYFNFFMGSFNKLAAFLHWNYSTQFLEIALPIGLSFHTFQSLSYVIEVYRGNFKAEKHFGIYALYVMFFPQLVAGPIERPQHLLPQFFKKHNFDYDRVTSGLKLIAWGLFKKIVIADRLAVIVNVVYNNPTHHSGIMLVIATFFFAYQIYCDFSGYSDIAIGSARVLGFDLMQNFRHPYFSTSIKEFWQRWHISLSTWFRDYLYISLGGNRVSKWKWYRNLFITFVVSGIWHGANWTYAVWGALHGFYYVCSIGTQSFREQVVKRLNINRHARMCQLLRMLWVFLLVAFAWIFFRANNLHEAVYICTHLFSGVDNIQLSLHEAGLTSKKFVINVLLILILEGVQYWSRRGEIPTLVAKFPTPVRWSIYYALIGAIIFLGEFKPSQFIYFQF